MRVLVLVLYLAASGGCYLSHARTGDAGSALDARVDGPVVRPDVPEPLVCGRLVIARTAELRDGPARGSVTPRLAALADGNVGVVYVRTDGMPTAVFYERRDRNLMRVGDPMRIGADSFTWAEIAAVGERVFIAYGVEGRSVFQERGLDGAGLGRVEVELGHPTFFLPVASGFFWSHFDSRGTNGFVSSTVARDGALLHEPVRIELGRYGSGHHAVVRPDGRTVVLGYPREGPPGARHGYLNAVDELTPGTGPERRLSEEDITSVFPLRLGEDLITLWNGDSLGIERDDWGTFEARDQVILPPIDEPFVAGTLAGHVVVARFGPGVLHVDVYDRDFAFEETLETSLPTPTLGPGTSTANLPGALVIATGLTAGPESFPWLARIECAD